MLNRRARREMRAEFAARVEQPHPLTADEIASIINAGEHRQRVVLDGALIRHLSRRHPLRMKRLSRELTWMQDEARRAGIDVEFVRP